MLDCSNKRHLVRRREQASKAAGKEVGHWPMLCRTTLLPCFHRLICIVCFRIAATYRTSLAYAIGAAFLAGGISAAWMIPAPIWFIVLDLVGAYIPMSWIGILLIRGTKGRTKPIATAETGQRLAG